MVSKPSILPLLISIFTSSILNSDPLLISNHLDLYKQFKLFNLYYVRITKVPGFGTMDKTISNILPLIKNSKKPT